MAIREETYEQTMQSIRDNVAAGLKANWHIVGKGKPATAQNIYTLADELMSKPGDYVNYEGKIVSSDDPNAIPTNQTAQEIARRTSEGVAANAPDFRENFWGTLMTYLAAAFTWLVENVSAMFGGNDGKPARSFSQIVADSVTPKMQEAVGQSLGEMATDPKHKAFFERNKIIETAQAQIANGVAVQAGLPGAEAAKPFDINAAPEGRSAPPPAPQISDADPKDVKIEKLLEAAAAPIEALAQAQNLPAEKIAETKQRLIAAGRDIALDPSQAETLKDPTKYAEAVLARGLPELDAKSSEYMILKNELLKALQSKPSGQEKSLHVSLVETATDKTLSAEEQQKLAEVKVDYDAQKQSLRSDVYKQAFEATMEQMDFKVAQGLIDKKGPLGGSYYTPPNGKALKDMTHAELLADPNFIAARKTARDYGYAPTEEQQIAISHMVALGTRDATFDERNKGKNQAEMAAAIAESVRARLSSPEAAAISQPNTQAATQSLPETEALNAVNPAHAAKLRANRGLGIEPGWVADTFQLGKPEKLTDETVERTWTQRISEGVGSALQTNNAVMDKLAAARDAFHEASIQQAQTAPTAQPNPQENAALTRGNNQQFAALLERAGEIPVDRSGHPSGLSGDVRREQPRGVDAPSVA